MYYINFSAQVTLTDLPEALPLLRLNINENKAKIGSMGGYAIAETLVWGESSDILDEEFDMIVLADCIYYEEVNSSIKVQHFYLIILNFIIILEFIEALRFYLLNVSIIIHMNKYHNNEVPS